MAAFVWSAVAARELGLAPPADVHSLASTVLAALRALPRHEPTGLFFNWYDATDGSLADHYRRGRRTQPFVSSVDNAWLAAVLLLLERDPPLADQAASLAASMDFSVFGGPEDDLAAPLHGGFWVRRTRRRSVASSRLRDGSRVALTPHRYDLLNSETRILSLVCLIRGVRSPEHLQHLSAPEVIFQGRRLTTSWGGSMFEALAPSVLVPELTWAPYTWGRNHAATVAAHLGHAESLGYREWGFSPCARPERGYAEFGVPPIAAGTGYPSAWRGDPVVTPHAAGLALAVAPEAAHACLSRLSSRPGVLGPGGFVDSVGLRSGRTAGRHLVLDQGMLLGGIASHLVPEAMHAGFTASAVESLIQGPLSDPAIFQPDPRPME